MKHTLSIITLLAIIMACKTSNSIPKAKAVSLESVTQSFREHAAKIAVLEYDIQRIDTFADGTVWDNRGVALLEKDPQDKLFGFSFFAKRHDIPKEYIYSNGNEFTISKAEKSYQMFEGHAGFLGSPGGQMIHKGIFTLDTLYQTATLEVVDDRYILKYTYEDNPKHNVKNKTKTIELNQKDFFPILIKETYIILENKAVHQMIFSNIRINEAVQQSIQSHKSSIHDFELIQPPQETPNKILHKKFPEIELPNILNENQMVNLTTDKLTLLDFWEVWCRWCIKSFPEVERLKNQFPDHLQVVGIVTEDKKNALKLIEKKGVSFMNLLGTKDILKQYHVNSYPRYFLIDKKGIVQKEYHGFSKEIEADIKKMIAQ